MKYLDDILALIGFAFIVYGVSLWSTVAAWITAGVFCLVLAALIAWSKRT